MPGYARGGYAKGGYVGRWYAGGWYAGGEDARRALVEQTGPDRRREIVLL
jgi:hypothetical protein